MTLEYAKYWHKPVSTIMNDAPKDWEIIMLTYIISNKLTDIYTKNIKQPDNSVLVSSTGAYIVNINAVNNILNKIYTNNKFKLLSNFHHVADHYIFALLNTYTYKYPYFTYSYTNDSTLHPEHLPGHIFSKEIAFNNTWGKMETFAQDNNILIYIILLFIILLLICLILFTNLTIVK